jgi:hypothetical protein
LDEDKFKHASLVQENGFGSAYLPSLLRVVKGTSRVNTWRKEYKRYDMTAEQCV